jgi:uncharacterized damage-inducible protein DinB
MLAPSLSALPNPISLPAGDSSVKVKNGEGGLLGPPYYYSSRFHPCQQAENGENMANTDLGESVCAALIAELEQLRDEVRKLADALSDGQLWSRPLKQSNSIGHLVLHLTGNLNHFVGAQLGKTGYVREREREFTETNPPAREELFSRFNEAVATFRRVVGGLTEQQLLAPHPHERFGTVIQTLVHLVAHFALHRGQMSYIARLVEP